MELFVPKAYSIRCFLYVPKKEKEQAPKNSVSNRKNYIKKIKSRKKYVKPIKSKGEKKNFLFFLRKVAVKLYRNKTIPPFR